MWPIKNFQKYFMVHQYMPKTFHDPYRNPLAPPPTFLMCGPLHENMLLYYLFKDLMKEYLTVPIDFHDSYFKKLLHDHALSMILKSQQIEILLTHINEPKNLKMDRKI